MSANAANARDVALLGVACLAYAALLWIVEHRPAVTIDADSAAKFARGLQYGKARAAELKRQEFSNGD